jgi:hypothetical protein
MGKSGGEGQMTRPDFEQVRALIRGRLAASAPLHRKAWHRVGDCDLDSLEPGIAEDVAEIQELAIALKAANVDIGALLAAIDELTARNAKLEGENEALKGLLHLEKGTDCQACLNRPYEAGPCPKHSRPGRPR